MNPLEQAKKYLEWGLNPIPLRKGGKEPIKKKWGSDISKDVNKYSFNHGTGLCTGVISGGLEVIDFDLKNAENPDKMWKDWKSLLPNDLLKKLVVSTTINNGYHLFYRTDIIEGSKKLANNPPPPNSNKKKGKTTIETKAEGGYVVCSPSKGYNIIYGDLQHINKISSDEKEMLFRASRLFDGSILEPKIHYSSSNEWEDPFPEYNSDPNNGINLLEEHGWVIRDQSDLWVEFVRPGKKEGLSGGYNLEGKFFYCFTTSTAFESEKPISNSALYCILNHDENYHEGYKELRKLEADKILHDLSFISQDGEDEEKLIQTIEGTIPLGLSYGWKDLDEQLVWKDNTLTFTLGLEGIGKTYMTLHKLVALSVLYDKKFAICSGENDIYEIKRILIEAVSGKDISYFKGKDLELQVHKDFIKKNFFIIKNLVHLSVEDVLERGKKLFEAYNIDGIFIDPFSYFKKPSSNQFAYTDLLLSDLKMFSNNFCSVIMSVHPNSEGARAVRSKEGYLNAPYKYSTSMGNMFANRSDSFLVYHRILDHRVKEYRNIMEIKVCKVRTISTGGCVTPVDQSLSLTYKTVNGFTGYFDDSGNNPMYKALNKDNNIEITQEKVEEKEDIFSDCPF